MPQRVPTRLPAAANADRGDRAALVRGPVDWLEAMNEALAVYQKDGNATEAARVAVNIADAFVNSDAAQYAATSLLLKAGSPDRALRLRATRDQARRPRPSSTT